MAQDSGNGARAFIPERGYDQLRRRATSRGNGAFVVCTFRYAVSLAMSLGGISEWLRICNETIPL